MTKNNLLQKLALAGVVAGAAFIAAPMNANAGTFIIDDFKGNDAAPSPSSTVTDNTPDNNPGIQGTGVYLSPTPIDIQNTVMGSKVAVDGDTTTLNGWTRGIYAELDTGSSTDVVTTRVCYNCNQGHIQTDTNASGNSSWIYNSGTGLDLSSFTDFMVKYDADLPGGIVQLWIDNTIAYQSGALPIGVTNIKAPLLFSPDSSVTDLRINILGVTSLDANIYDVKLTSVPEPSSVLGLLALGGLGLGLKRKKQG